MKISSNNQAGMNHSAFLPLKRFHHHVVNCFASLPKNGKVWKVIKRVCLICAAPFVYLALTFYALFGILFSKKTQISGKSSLHPQVDATDRISTCLPFLIKESKAQMQASAGQIIDDHRIQKIKYLIFCTFGDKTKKYEMSLSSDDFITADLLNRSIERVHQCMRSWILEQTDADAKFLPTAIKGEAFCLGENLFHHASCKSEAASAKDSRGSYSMTTVDPDSISEYISQSLYDLGCLNPADDVLQNGVFNERLLPDAQVL